MFCAFRRACFLDSKQNSYFFSNLQAMLTQTIVKQKLTNNKNKAQRLNGWNVVLFFFFNGPLGTFLEAIHFGALKRPLGGVWDAFWRPLGTLLEPCGCSLGRFGRILDAWASKMPSRIPEGGTKSSLRWPREAPRRPKRARKGSQETLKGPRRLPNNPKTTFKLKLRKTSKMTVFLMKINDFWGRPPQNQGQNNRKNQENATK